MKVVAIAGGLAGLHWYLERAGDAASAHWLTAGAAVIALVALSLFRESAR